MIQISSVIFIKMFISKTVGAWKSQVRQATKYSAVQFLRTYGSYDYITGFGDSWNDISLFQACDESYAVANASSKLKAIATATIKSNIEDGVADFLSKLLK